MTRTGLRDAVAIVGVGSTGYRRHGQHRSALRLAVEASVAAVRDAGLTRHDVDGLVATHAPPVTRVADALGLGGLTHLGNQRPPFPFALVDAVNAVYAGACETALVVHAVVRGPGQSRSAAADPFRRHVTLGPRPGGDPEFAGQPMCFALWASRYAYEFGLPREALGRIAVNARSTARDNPLAAMREALSLGEYLDARMVREPLCLYDMDLPVDGADALVVTSAERAAAMGRPAVLVHAVAVGTSAPADEARAPGLTDHGQHLAVARLRERSAYWLDDADVHYAYDGFTSITAAWLESVGWCGQGKAPDYLVKCWDEQAQRLFLDGRVPLNPHGGNLAEGASQGAGHVRDAVVQLRGEAGVRQVPAARTALLTLGGMFTNACGLVLRAA